MRQGGEELAAVTGAKLINESRAEAVSMAERGYLTANIEIIWGPKSNQRLRKRGASPRHSKITVLCRAVQPLKEELALSGLMVNLDRKIDRILAAGSSTFEIVANAVCATRP